MQVNYFLKLKLSVDWMFLDDLIGKIRKHLLADIEIEPITPPTEANRIPQWTSLAFSRQSGSPDDLGVVVMQAIRDAGLADRFEQA